MKFSVDDFLAKLPLQPDEKWREGVPFVTAFAKGSMSLEFFALRGKDFQTPHEQDELYAVVQGSGEFVRNGERTTFKSGDVLFVPAKMEHYFENVSADFATWVIFFNSEQ